MKKKVSLLFLLFGLNLFIIQAQTNICFNPIYQTTTSYDANIIISADFNNDGKVDLATNGFNNFEGIFILMGDGSGGFIDTNIYPVRDVIGLICSDFNNDGKKDIVAMAYDTIAILVGNGSGSFATPVKFFSNDNTALSPFSNRLLTSGDFNTDGNLDVALINENIGVTFLFGNGNGSFGTPQNDTLSVVNYGSIIICQDFNNDNKADLAVTGVGISILLGNGTGSFAAPINISSVYSPTSLTGDDFNNDGKVDIAVTNNDSLYVFLGQGNGMFNNTITSGYKKNQLSIWPADFNADGKVDLVTGYKYAYYDTNGQQDSTLFAVLTGDGAGNFFMADTFKLASGFFSVATADFNNDNRTDMAITSYTMGTSATVLINCSPATLTNTTTYINNEVANNNLTNIYPNPANDSFIIETTSIEKQTLEIVDVTGKIVLCQELNNKTNIDASNLDNGIYFIQLKSNENIYTQKIIIQH